MRTVFLYRNIDRMDKDELPFAEKYFDFCTNSRMDLQPGDLIVSRYSFLPFAEEQCRDFARVGAIPLNSFKQHRYIADLQNWYEDLKGLTPETWTELDQIPEVGPFFLKGETNSKKFLFDTHCYAETKAEAIQVYLRLLDDGTIGTQKIYIRRYEKLITYDTAPHGLPITKEFRFFIAFNKVLCGAFYWSMYSEELKEQGNYPDVSEVPQEFLEEVIKRVDGQANAYVIDVGQKEDGSWIVIELNDLTMSGLSDNDPDVLYRRLLEEIKAGFKA